MGLGRQMHHQVRLEAVQRRPHALGVADVALNEAVARVIAHRASEARLPAIGQLVEASTPARRCRSGSAPRPSDEPRAAGDENALRHGSDLSRIAKGAVEVLEARQDRILFRDHSVLHRPLDGRSGSFQMIPPSLTFE